MYSFDAAQQVKSAKEFIADPRSRIATGFPSMDGLLRRGGLAPGTLCLLGGRPRTRKTTVVFNMIAKMLSVGHTVGLVGMDEAQHDYTLKLMSCMFMEPLHKIEQALEEPNSSIEEKYYELAERFQMFNGYAADCPDDLSQWLLDIEMNYFQRPQVVFIDHTSKLKTRKYDGSGLNRVEKIMERLHAWTKQNQLVVIAIHHVGRIDEGANIRYHGESPMSLEGLRYGGEGDADIVFGCYRPALDPFGHMTEDTARQYKGQSFKEEEYLAAQQRITKYQDYTFLQLLKNRPGTEVNEAGVPLKSQGATMRMDEDYEVLSRPEHPDWDLGVQEDETKAYG